MFRALSCLVILSTVMSMTGCDRDGQPIQQFGLEKLAVGISSEGDVRNAMGKPETTWEEEDGTRILEYPKGTEGVRTWIFTIDTNGKLVEYHQALSPENFAQIKAGMSRDNVRRLLGKPRTVVNFNRLKEEVWDYRYLDNQQARLFNIHFDQAIQKVTRTSASEIGN
jgi:outer membrane protein assembly factor BamE (lipoprotein component of BamABCDE complex)